mmetsp:Transcript_9756/g.31776  ORF Transcript_9756/g.31776 Transcript_9756/m.31776 type:complete len:353 (+) Transcript_9756:1383-2441(+)
MSTKSFTNEGVDVVVFAESAAKSRTASKKSVGFSKDVRADWYLMAAKRKVVILSQRWRISLSEAWSLLGSLAPPSPPKEEVASTRMVFRETSTEVRGALVSRMELSKAEARALLSETSRTRRFTEVRTNQETQPMPVAWSWFPDRSRTRRFRQVDATRSKRATAPATSGEGFNWHCRRVRHSSACAVFRASARIAAPRSPSLFFDRSTATLRASKRSEGKKAMAPPLSPETTPEPEEETPEEPETTPETTPEPPTVTPPLFGGERPTSLRAIRRMVVDLAMAGKTKSSKPSILTASRVTPSKRSECLRTPATAAASRRVIFDEPSGLVHWNMPGLRSAWAKSSEVAGFGARR